MVAIPIGYDQPGVAARIAHHGVGEFLEVKDLTVDRLHGLIQKVLETPGYRDKALYFRKVITQTRGLDIAADALERAFVESQAADQDEACRDLAGLRGMLLPGVQGARSAGFSGRGWDQASRSVCTIWNICCPCGLVKSGLSAVAIDTTEDTIPPLSRI